MEQHGWLLPVLLDVDSRLYQRYCVWQHTLETYEIIPVQPIQFLHFGDPGLEDCLQMILQCLRVIPRHWNTADSRFMPYFVDWVLFALGHPLVTELPPIPSYCEGASDRLEQVFDLGLLYTAPADYLGYILATETYGKWSAGKFYPTWPGCANLMAESAARTMVLRSALDPPYHVFEPCIGTGRLTMAMSNYARSLTGWDWDSFLMRIALMNFTLWCPDFALPIPGLGGDLIYGNALTGEGQSIFCPERVYTQCPVELTPEPTTPLPKLVPEPRYEQRSLFDVGAL